MTINEELIKENPVQIYSSESIQKHLHVNLNTEVKEPYHYGDINQHLRSLGQDDIVHLHINSPGGQLASAIELIYNLQQCPATVIGYLGADASSAGSMIFLSCDAWEIHDLSTLMIHNGSGGYAGAVPNMREHSKHVDELLKRCLKKYYKGFLTDEEIQSHIDGRPDQFMFAEEIEERLTNLHQYRIDQYEEQLKEQEDEDESECVLNETDGSD